MVIVVMDSGMCVLSLTLSENYCLISYLRSVQVLGKTLPLQVKVNLKDCIFQML